MQDIGGTSNLPMLSVFQVLIETLNLTNWYVGTDKKGENMSTSNH